MYLVLKILRFPLLYENETHKPVAFEDEPLSVHAQRLRHILNDYENTFSETHRRVHYCHRGHNACPICPAIYAGLQAIDDLIEISQILTKTYKKSFTYHKQPNNLYRWKLTR